MRIRRSLAALAAVFALTLPATASAADKTGSVGDVAGVDVYSSSSDTYLKYHGRLFVDTNKGSEEYRWGGTSCNSKTISDDMVALLITAIGSPRVVVKPRYKSGQGNARCLVGFSLQEKGGNGRGRGRK